MACVVDDSGWVCGYGSIERECGGGEERRGRTEWGGAVGRRGADAGGVVSDARLSPPTPHQLPLCPCCTHQHRLSHSLQPPSRRPPRDPPPPLPHLFIAAALYREPTMAAPTSATAAFDTVATSQLTFWLNGTKVVLDASQIDPDTTLLAFLRSQPGLTGTKQGCNEGGCGAVRSSPLPLVECAYGGAQADPRAPTVHRRPPEHPPAHQRGAAPRHQRVPRAPRLPRGQALHHGRGHRQLGQPAPAPGAHVQAPRLAVRLLHARHRASLPSPSPASSRRESRTDPDRTHARRS